MRDYVVPWHVFVRAISLRDPTLSFLPSSQRCIHTFRDCPIASSSSSTLKRENNYDPIESSSLLFFSGQCKGRWWLQLRRPSEFGRGCYNVEQRSHLFLLPATLTVMKAVSSEPFLVISSWYNSLPFLYIKRRNTKGTRKTSPYKDPGHRHSKMSFPLVYWAETPRAKFRFVFLSGTPAWSFWRNSWSFGPCSLTVWVHPSRFRSSPQFLLRQQSEPHSSFPPLGCIPYMRSSWVSAIYQSRLWL